MSLNTINAWFLRVHEHHPVGEITKIQFVCRVGDDYVRYTLQQEMPPHLLCSHAMAFFADDYYYCRRCPLGYSINKVASIP